MKKVLKSLIAVVMMFSLTVLNGCKDKDNEDSIFGEYTFDKVVIYPDGFSEKPLTELTCKDEEYVEYYCYEEDAIYTKFSIKIEDEDTIIFTSYYGDEDEGVYESMDYLYTIEDGVILIATLSTKVNPRILIEGNSIKFAMKASDFVEPLVDVGGVDGELNTNKKDFYLVFTKN